MADLKLWQQRLAVFDQAALEVIANKGLLRRAKKDLQQGTVPKVVAIAPDKLQLQVEEATVTLPEQGPTQAACTCPAVETCRHILMACLWLGTLSDAVGEQPTQPSEGSGVAPTVPNPDTPTPDTAAATSLEQLSAELQASTIAQLTRWAGKKTVQTAREYLGACK